MANYVFYDHLVDMRLEDEGYGVPLVMRAPYRSQAQIGVYPQAEPNAGCTP